VHVAQVFSCCLGPQAISGPGLVQWQPRDDDDDVLEDKADVGDGVKADHIDGIDRNVNMTGASVFGGGDVINAGGTKENVFKSSANDSAVDDGVKIEVKIEGASSIKATKTSSSATPLLYRIDTNMSRMQSGGGSGAARRFVTPADVANGQYCVDERTQVQPSMQLSPTPDDHGSDDFNAAAHVDDESRSVSNAFAIVRNHKILWRVLMPCIQAALKICYSAGGGCARASAPASSSNHSTAAATSTSRSGASATGASSNIANEKANGTDGAANFARAANRKAHAQRLQFQAELYTLGAEYALSYGSVCDCVGAAECRHTQTGTHDYLSCGVSRR
jgi:hypothetical protein